MSRFETIEEEYLSIEPSDHDAQFAFYAKHSDFFESNPPEINNEFFQKFLWILSDIGTSYSIAGKHNKAIELLSKVIRLYEKYEDQLGVDLTNESYYNTAVWQKGISLLELNRFSEARSYVKRMKADNAYGQKEQIEQVVKIVNWKIRNRIAIVLGILGILILIVYVIGQLASSFDSFFVRNAGFVGGALLIASVVMHRKRMKSSL